MNPEIETPPLRAKQLGSELPPVAGRVMYMPAGTHTVTPGYDQGAAEVSLTIGPETVPVLNASLEAARAAHKPVRPMFDRNHEQKEATGWPERFEWSEQPEPGIYCQTDWTSLGRELISGRMFRHFSPAFHSDAKLPKKLAAGLHRIAAGLRGSKENPARVIAINFPDAGSLTNIPAFEKLLPLWAKNAAGAQSSAKPNQTKNMTTEALAALRAKKTELEQNLPVLKAADQAVAANAEALLTAENELNSVNASLEAEDLRAKNATLEAAVVAQRKKDSETAVKDAVLKGKIPAKDEALRAKWEKRCFEDPENIELLAMMRGSPALDRAVAPQRLILSGAHITREDTATVLLAYAQEKDPRKRGAIYAQELSERITKGEPLFFDRPALKAITNTLGTVVGDIVSQRTLEFMFSMRPILRAVTTDFSDEPARVNQKIVTRTIAAPVLQNLGGTVSDSTTADVSVTLDICKEARFQFTALEFTGTGRNLVQEHAEAMATTLGNYLVDALGALWDETYTNETVKALAAMDYSTISSIVRSMNARKVPDMGRFGVISSAVAEAFRNDEIIMEHFNRNTGSAYANWINIEGFTNIWEYPAFGVTDTAVDGVDVSPANNTEGFFASKSACVAACRLLTDPGTLMGLGYPGNLSVITEPISGLSVIKNTYVVQDTLAVGTRLILLGGVDEGQLACGQRLVTA